MELEFQLDSTDGLDDAIKPLYAEKDGKFTLNVKGAVPQSKFDEVNQRAVDATDEARRRRGTVDRVVKKLGLENADGLDGALDDVIAKSKQSGGKRTDEQHEQIIQALKDQHATEVNGLNDTIKGMKMDGAKSKFNAALVDVGFPTKAAEMIATTNMTRVKLDDDGNVRIMTEKNTPLAGSGGDGFATMADLATELAAALPEFLTDGGKGGGGKPPASGGKKSTQSTMKRTDWQKMSPVDKSKFLNDGGKLVD